MRSGLRPVVVCALPVALLLQVVPTAVFAQSLVCHTIRRGESVQQVARRVTGDSRNAYHTSFQIMNASSRFVPKSQYDRIRAGWRACLITPTRPPLSNEADTADPRHASDALPSSTPVELAADSRSLPLSAPLATADASEGVDHGLRAIAAEALEVIGRVDLMLVWLGAAVAVPLFGWRAIDGHLTRRKTMTLLVRHFATRFVNEFERPLRYHPTERTLLWRMRTSVRPGRFELLLAPAQGRRYPNLSDHRKNVEYDVARVMHTLDDPSFANGPVYAQAGWVVVPFQFLVRSVPGGRKAGSKQSGATCISSL